MKILWEDNAWEEYVKWQSQDKKTLKKIGLFIFMFLAKVGLRCSVWASHCSGFSGCRAQALGTWASVAVVPGL